MLNLISWLYPWGSFFHHSLYRWGVFDTQTLECPVFCVGNITSGGTGKTPAALKLAQDLKNLGKKPAILIRGYKRAAENREPVILLNGNRPVNETGDEALLLSKRLPEVPVIVSPDRTRAGRQAIETQGADCLIVDDGFQHWPLTRNLDIVCIDALLPFGGGLQEPGCFLREWPGALRRAGLLIITKSDLVTPEELEKLKGRLRRLSPEASIVESAYIPTLAAPSGKPVLADLSGRKILALSGIGSPLSFEKLLSRLGAGDVAYARFPDHHAFTRQELDRAFSRAQQEGRLVVTTEKDSVRMPDPTPFYTLRIETKLIDGENRWRAALEAPWSR
jgi:tetraacyldisaccharide 4'-kinase